MNRFYVGMFSLLCCSAANGQGYFVDLPRDLQLYPRNTSDQAEVVFSGVTDRGYSKISVQTLREGILTVTSSQTAAETIAGFPFRLTATIKAERAEYSFKVFLHKNRDSILIAEPKRVVCGDVYLVHGQSNAIPTGGLVQDYSITFDDKYLRNCDYLDNPANIRWYPAKEPFASVGVFGLAMQRHILNTYGIPTLFINGADGGKDIGVLTERDPANPANVVTRYGRLLYRARWAGVDKHVKAIFWRQGEADAGSGTPGYEQKFDQFYKNLRTDYGADMRMYVSQINILDNPAINNQVDIAPQIRDFQRRIKYLYPKTESIATVGTPGYDGVHYDTPGHQQLTFEQFRQVARDVYGSTDTIQINSPDIKKVFYNARKDSITLVFDDQMQMVWKADSATYDFSNGKLVKIRYLKDFFYLNGQDGLVTAGSASRNRVVLSLKQPGTARKIRYLPSFYSNALSIAYDGPTLKNTRGMRAFSFDNVTIADALPAVTTLVANGISDKQIRLSWTAPADAISQILERSIGTSTAFTQMGTVNGTTNTFTDNDTELTQTYFYRLRTVSISSESAYSPVVSARPLVLGVEPNPLAIRTYPNPVSVGTTLRIDADYLLIRAVLIGNVQGRTMNGWRGTPQQQIQVETNDLPTGIYVVDVQTTDGRSIRQKVIVQ